MRNRLALATALLGTGCWFDDGGSEPALDATVLDADLADAAAVDAATDGGPSDAGADAGGPARSYFDENVKPFLAARCDSCHATGVGDAPAFGVGYDAIVAYAGPRGTLVGCTLTESLLFTQGAHTGPALTGEEEESLQGFINLEAAARPACDGFVGDRPATGPLPSSVGHYTLDLSVRGFGLSGARLEFDLSEVARGLQLSDIVVQAGDNGLILIHPVFQTCRAVDDELARLRLELASNASELLGDGVILLEGAELGDELSLVFDALLPRAGAQGPPTDSGGACLPF